MSHFSRYTFAVAVALAAVPAAALVQPPATDTTGDAIDQGAVARLEVSRAYLRSLHSFEVRAETTIEDVVDGDAKVDLLNRVRYEYRAPDHLFADWQSDRRERRLYFDGRTATIYAPRVGYFARVEAPGTVAQMVRRAAEDYGIVFPLPDLFYWATRDTPAYDLQSAVYLGPARIAGVDTDHYLFRQADVDWQVWIERGDRPLPRKVVITDRTDPARPSTTALLQWNPDAQISEDHFTFTPPADATPIAVASAARGARR